MARYAFILSLAVASIGAFSQFGNAMDRTLVDQVRAEGASSSGATHATPSLSSRAQAAVASAIRGLARDISKIERGIWGLDSFVTSVAGGVHVGAKALEVKAQRVEDLSALRRLAQGVQELEPETKLTELLSYTRRRDIAETLAGRTVKASDNPELFDAERAYFEVRLRELASIEPRQRAALLSDLPLREGEPNSLFYLRGLGPHNVVGDYTVYGNMRRRFFELGEARRNGELPALDLHHRPLLFDLRNVKDLELLPGINKKLARRIAQADALDTLEDLKKVKGVDAELAGRMEKFLEKTLVVDRMMAATELKQLDERLALLSRTLFGERLKPGTKQPNVAKIRRELALDSWGTLHHDWVDRAYDAAELIREHVVVNHQGISDPLLSDRIRQRSYHEAARHITESAFGEPNAEFLELEKVLRERMEATWPPYDQARLKQPRRPTEGFVGGTADGFIGGNSGRPRL